MKFILTTIIGMTLVGSLFGQTDAEKQFIKDEFGRPYYLYKSELSISDKGFTVYIEVLRYNDILILDVEPYADFYSMMGLIGDENRLTDYVKSSLTQSHIVKFKKSSISTEHSLDLVSNYGFKITSDGYLFKKLNIIKPTGNAKKEIPKYLYYRLEYV